MPHDIVEGYAQRARRHKLTGQYIVFVKLDGVNDYLTRGIHHDDEAIWARCKACASEISEPSSVTGRSYLSALIQLRRRGGPKRGVEHALPPFRRPPWCFFRHGSTAIARRRGPQPKRSSTRLKAGCCRFLTLTQCGDAAGAIGAVAVLRDQAFKAHQAGMAEQVRADLALLEIGQEDSVDAARQQPRQGCPCAS